SWGREDTPKDYSSLHRKIRTQSISDKEAKMPKTITIDADSSKEIDLGNSNVFTITANGGNATVHVDYNRDGTYWTAIREETGIGNPFSVGDGQTKVINRTDLKSEHVRIAAKSAKITVTY